MSVEKKTNYFDFTLEPGIYKFAIICGDDYTNYKHELIISKATDKVTKKSKSSSSSSKQSSMIIKLDKSSKFQITEYIEEYSILETEALYKIHTKLYFEDPTIGWVQVADIYYHKYWSEVDDNIYSYYESNNDKFYGKFILKSSIFTEYKTTNSYNFKHLNIKNASKSAKKTPPIDIISAMAHLNKILIENKLKLENICKIYDHSYLINNVKIDKKTRADLKVFEKMSMDQIKDHYLKYKDIVKNIAIV